MSLPELQSLITITAIILAGAWTLYRFGISREQYPKLQFDMHLNKLGTSRDKHLIELVATITNKGIARQYISDFKFNILTFSDDMPFDLTDEKIEKRLKFKETAKGLKWVNTKHVTFVDGGMSHAFTFVTALDKEVRLVMIYSKFDHESKRFGMKNAEHYRMAKTFAV